MNIIKNLMTTPNELTIPIMNTPNEVTIPIMNQPTATPIQNPVRMMAIPLIIFNIIVTIALITIIAIIVMV